MTFFPFHKNAVYGKLINHYPLAGFGWETILHSKWNGTCSESFTPGGTITVLSVIEILCLIHEETLNTSDCGKKLQYILSVYGSGIFAGTSITRHLKMRNLRSWGWHDLSNSFWLHLRNTQLPTCRIWYKYGKTSPDWRQKNSRKTGTENFKRRTEYKLFTMVAHLYSVVFLCILSSYYALVYAGVMQLEHPQQAFCEADFGKFVAKFIKLKVA